MKTFSPRTRELALQIAHGFCQCHPHCTKQASEFHHILSNTKVNQNKYPLFIQSIFNCCPINRDCHMVKPVPRIRESAAEAYEQYLKELINER